MWEQTFKSKCNPCDSFVHGSAAQVTHVCKDVAPQEDGIRFRSTSITDYECILIDLHLWVCSINLYKSSINARKTNLCTRLQWPYPRPYGAADVLVWTFTEHSQTHFNKCIVVLPCYHIQCLSFWWWASCHVTWKAFVVMMNMNDVYPLLVEGTWAGIEFTCDIYELAGIMFLVLLQVRGFCLTQPSHARGT